MKLTRELATKLCNLSLKSEFKIFINGEDTGYLTLDSKDVVVSDKYFWYFDDEVEVAIYQLNNDILEA